MLHKESGQPYRRCTRKPLLIRWRSACAVFSTQPQRLRLNLIIPLPSLTIYATRPQIHQLEHTTAIATPIGNTPILDRANSSPEARKRVSLPAGFEGHMSLVFEWQTEETVSGKS